MAKVMVCDICKKDGKLIETKTYMKVKNRSDLRVDYCPSCKKKIPSNMIEYVKFVYGLNGLTVDDEFAQTTLRRS